MIVPITAKSDLKATTLAAIFSMWLANNILFDFCSGPDSFDGYSSSPNINLPKSKKISVAKRLLDLTDNAPKGVLCRTYQMRRYSLPSNFTLDDLYDADTRLHNREASSVDHLPDWFPRTPVRNLFGNCAQFVGSAVGKFFRKFLPQRMAKEVLVFALYRLPGFSRMEAEEIRAINRFKKEEAIRILHCSPSMPDREIQFRIAVVYHAVLAESPDGIIEFWF